MCWGGRRGKGKKEKQDGREEREILRSGLCSLVPYHACGQRIMCRKSIVFPPCAPWTASSGRPSGREARAFTCWAILPGFNISNSFLNSSERCSFSFPVFFTTPLGSVTQVHREDMFGPQLLGPLTLTSYRLRLNLPLDGCNIYKYKACLIWQVSLFL